MIRRYRSRMFPYLHALVGMAAVTALIYGSHPTGVVETLIWNLYLVPVGLLAYRWGLVPGLIAGAVSLVCLLPTLLPAMMGYGLSMHTVSHIATAVLLISFPAAVDSVVSPRRRQTELERALHRLNQLLEERLSMGRLANLILREAMDSCRADCGFAYLQDKATGSFELGGSLVTECAAEGEAIRARMASQTMKRRMSFVTGPVIINRLDEEAPEGSGDRSEADGPLASCSFAAVPLWSGATGFGVITLVRTGSETFDEGSMGTLESIAKTSQTALEQAWLHGELERTATELTVLNDLGRAASGSLNLRETVENVITSLQRAFPDWSIELLHQDEGLTGPTMRARAYDRRIEYFDSSQPPEGLFPTTVMAAHRPLTMGDLRLLGLPMLEPDLGRQFEGFYGLPLVVGPKTIGAICFYSPRPEAFSGRWCRLLQAATPQVAVALSNASLYGETDQQLSRKLMEVSILQRLGKEFNSTLDLDRLLGLVLRQSLLLTTGDRGAIALWDQDADGLNPKLAGGDVSELWAQAEEGLRRLIERETLLLEDGDGAGNPEGRPSRLGVPIRRLSRTMGAIYLEAGRPVAFSSADAAFLSHVGENAAIAIENARLYAESMARTRDVEQLLSVSKLLSSTVQLDELLRTLAGTLVASLQVAFCHISLLDEEGRSLVVRAVAAASHMVEVPGGEGIQFPMEQVPRFMEAVRSHRFLLVRQDLPETAFDPEELTLVADHRTRAALLVPLVLKERVLGVITVAEHRRWERSPITPEKIGLCQAMASQAAIAIENARLFNTMVEEQKRTQHILAGMADGVFTTDRQRRILSFNPAAERITGWKRDEILGRSCCDVMRPAQGSEASCGDSCPLLESMERGVVAKIGPVLWQVSERNLGQLQVACSVAPLDDGKGATVGSVTVFRDVTREAELDQLKSDFVSMVSHELRSPLASIGAAAELLRRDAGSGSGGPSYLLEVIHTQAMQLGDFVEDVLNVSRLYRGALDLEVEPVPLVPILKRAIAIAQATTSQHRIELKGGPEPPLVMADIRRMEIVVSNLLRNAINYSPEGGAIGVEVRKEGSEVVVCVEDHGIGISEEQWERIFERFTRADNRDAKTVYGHGLGLYIARGIVQQHGGRIWVESQVGQGSRFSFALPVFQDRRSSYPISRPSAGRPARADLGSHGRRKGDIQ